MERSRSDEIRLNLESRDTEFLACPPLALSRDPSSGKNPRRCLYSATDRSVETATTAIVVLPGDCVPGYHRGGVLDRARVPRLVSDWDPNFAKGMAMTVACSRAPRSNTWPVANQLLHASLWTGCIIARVSITHPGIDASRVDPRDRGS